MKSSPIIFSTELVQAILDGKKTQTRRIVRKQPPGSMEFQGWIHDSTNRKEIGKAMWTDPDHKFTHIEKCPYGKPGDLLWVKETWAFAQRIEPDYDTIFWDWQSLDWYPKDGETEPGYKFIHKASTHEDDFNGQWRSSRFMPKVASRITLEITNIKPQRIQDITIDDIKAEGIWLKPDASKNWNETAMAYVFTFTELWDRLNAARGFGMNINPWVWAITFKVKEIKK